MRPGLPRTATGTVRRRVALHHRPVLMAARCLNVPANGQLLSGEHRGWLSLATNSKATAVDRCRRCRSNIAAVSGDELFGGSLQR